MTFSLRPPGLLNMWACNVVACMCADVRRHGYQNNALQSSTVCTVAGVRVSECVSACVNE